MECSHSTEPCRMLEDTSQVLTGIHASEIPFKGNNGQNKKKPLNTDSCGFHGQVKIPKISSNLSKTEEYYNLESVQKQPMLLSMPLLNDDVSPGEMSNLNKGCKSHLQSSVGQLGVQKKLSDYTTNSVSSHQLPIDNIAVQIQDTMPLTATMCKSQNLSSEVTYHDNNLCTSEQEKNVIGASSTLHKYKNILDPNSGVLNNEPDTRNIHLANEITPSASEKVISGTANISVQMEMQNSVKKEEIKFITEFKQEDKSWIRAYTRNYSTRSDRNVLKEPEIIIIDDDDCDDIHISKMNTSHAAPVPKENKVAEFSGILSVEPEIIVVYPCSDGRIYNNYKPCYHGIIDTTEPEIQFNSFCNEDVSLEGVISLMKYGGNEYIVVENSNYENASMQYSISAAETAPLKIKNVIDYFRNTLKDPIDVMVQNDKIIVAGRHKTIISCLVFLYYNYQYFFQTILNTVRMLEEVLHTKLNYMKLSEEMEIGISKLPHNSKLKIKEMKEARLFKKDNFERGACQFSRLFNQIVQNFKDFRSLPPFYRTLFSLILFQRIVYHLHSNDPDHIQKHFFGIRFIIKALLNYGNGDMQLISLLTEKSNDDFVSDFNTVTRSIRVFQLAAAYHYSGGVSNRNQQDCKVSIYMPDLSSTSLSDNSGTDNNVHAYAPVFSKSPSVSSTQLQHVNDTTQSLISNLEAGRQTQPLNRRVQQIDRPPQDVLSNRQAGQSEQRPLPLLVSKPTPVYYTTWKY